MDLPQWVIWRYEQAAGRTKPTKVLYQAARPGLHASSTKSATWATYEDALEAVDHGDGIGFVFSNDDGYLGVDLDGCIENGVMVDWAEEIVGILNSYTEYSPSREGVHIFVRATLPGGGRKRGKFEIYDRGRYFTFTGSHYPGTPHTIEDRQAEVDALIEELEPKGQTEYRDPPPVLRLDDADVIRKARNAKNGDKFTRLWAGDISGYPSQSEAEQALCNLLSFWVGRDEVAIDRLFRQSGLYRPKWDEKHYGDGRTYGAGTVGKATGVREVYAAGARVATTVTPIDAETGEITRWMTARELADKTPEEPAWIVPGLLACGVITELSAKIKVGKTTFWGAMVAAILNGEPFLGLPTTTTPVVLLTEERESSIRALLKRTGLEHEDHLHILQRYLTRGTEWPAIVSDAISYTHKVGARLLIVDTLPDWAGIVGDAENNSGDALEAMAPLQDAAASGLAVLPVRHDRKGGGEIGDSARGSSAFGGAVDIILGLRRAESPGHENRRTLVGVGRFDGIPEEITIELNGGKYTSLGNGADVDRREVRTLLFEILPEPGNRGLTVEELLDGVGETHRATLNRILKEAVKDGDVLRSKGYGTTGRAFGYTAARVMNFSPPRTPEKLIDSGVPSSVEGVPLGEGPSMAPPGVPLRTENNELFRARSLGEKLLEDEEDIQPW